MRHTRATQARTGLLCARHMHRAHLTRAHPATTDSESTRALHYHDRNKPQPAHNCTVAASQHQHTEHYHFKAALRHSAITARYANPTTAFRPSYHGMTLPPFRECLSVQAFNLLLTCWESHLESEPDSGKMYHGTHQSQTRLRPVGAGLRVTNAHSHPWPS